MRQRSANNPPTVLVRPPTSPVIMGYPRCRRVVRLPELRWKGFPMLDSAFAATGQQTNRRKGGGRAYRIQVHTPAQRATGTDPGLVPRRCDIRSRLALPVGAVGDLRMADRRPVVDNLSATGSQPANARVGNHCL